MNQALHIVPRPQETETERLVRLINELRSGKLDTILIQRDIKNRNQLYIKGLVNSKA